MTTRNYRLARGAEIPEDKIAALAYEKWVERGCEHGQDLRDWLDAETELHELSVLAGFVHPEIQLEASRKGAYFGRGREATGLAGLTTFEPGAEGFDVMTMSRFGTVFDAQQREVAILNLEEGVFTFTPVDNSQNRWKSVIESIRVLLSEGAAEIGADGEVRIVVAAEKQPQRIPLSSRIQSLSREQLHLVYDPQGLREVRLAELELQLHRSESSRPLKDVLEDLDFQGE